jgi:H-type lectin domain
MAVPTRPAAGAPTDVTWGQTVHDSIAAMDLQSGEGTVTFPGGSAVSNALTVVFPRPFASAPNVVATAGGAAGAGVNYVCSVNTITATGMSVQMREVRETVTSGTKPVNWIAYGPRA